MSCEVCNESSENCVDGDPAPFMCSFSGKTSFDVSVNDRNVANVVLGICCFISATFILIGCVIRFSDYVKHSGRRYHPRSDENELQEVYNLGYSSSERNSGGRGQRYPPYNHPGTLELTNRRSRELLSLDVSEMVETSGKGSHISDLPFYVKTSDIVLHELLAAGFYGKVLSARWQGNWVAVKVLKHKKADQLNEVLNEVALLVRLRHPNVIAFYGCTAPPEPYIISELLWGSLFKLIFDYDPYPRKEGGGNNISSKGDKVDEHLSDMVKFRIVKDIANGMSYIHDCGIIHRDLSSSNVLVTGPREELEALVRKDDINLPAFAKIADFGLSRGVDEGQDPAPVNLLYLSPEGYRGEPISTQSDVFSYSLVMWETYVCERPFNDEVNEQISAYKVTCEGLRPPIISKIPGGISMLMKDCWIDDPRDRPTMKAVVVALEEMEKLWRTHSQAYLTDEDNDTGDGKWDGVAVKPAMNTYSAFDDEDDRRGMMEKRGSSRGSFRIGDINPLPDDDSANELEDDDIDDGPLDEGNDDSCGTPKCLQSLITSDTVESLSSFSLDRKAKTHLKNIELHTSVSAPPLNDKGGGRVVVNDVYHDFFTSPSSLRSQSTTGMLQDDVPRGEGEERGSTNNNK